MFASAPVRHRIIAFVCSLALAFALVPLMPDMQRAQAAPTLDVTFDEATGLATWKAIAGEDEYWCDCEVLEPVGEEGIGFSSNSAIPDSDGNYSWSFKDQLDGGLANGYIQSAPVYIISIFVIDTKEGTLTLWKRNYSYTPSTKKVENVVFDLSTYELNWTEPTGADHYYFDIKNSSGYTSVGSCPVQLGTIIDNLITENRLPKSSGDTYTVVIKAYNAKNMLIAQSDPVTITYASAAKPHPLGSLAVTFDSTTGIAKWNAYAGASSYWCGVDEASLSLTETEVNFTSIADVLYTNGKIGGSGPYDLEIIACNDSGAHIARWTGSFVYTPKIVTGVIPGLSELPVAFDVSTGKATWSAIGGSDSYWCGVDGGSIPLGNTTNADFKALLDMFYTQGHITQKGSYTICVSAYKSDSGALVGQWSTTFSYTPKKVVETVPAPSPSPSIPSLPVTFKASTGTATWKAYSGAKAYFMIVDDRLLATTGKKADFKDAIDGLYLSGGVKKKKTYTVGVAAYSKGSKTLLARWTKTFTYTPAPNIKRATFGKLTSQICTGKKVKPKLNATIGTVTLKKNKHYTVTFKNNKNIGKATATIKGKGLVKGKVKKTFKIVPASPSLRLTSTGKNKATVAWKHATKGTDGVQVKYGYNMYMKNAKSKTIKGTSKKKLKLTKLKNNKTIFTWIRCWKKVKGTKYYSAWTTIWYDVL